jgi:hypothetical protein
MTVLLGYREKKDVEECPLPKEKVGFAKGTKYSKVSKI